MTLPFRRRTAAPAYVVERLTNEWRVIDGRWRRRVVVRYPDGRLQAAWMLDEVAA